MGFRSFTRFYVLTIVVSTLALGVQLRAAAPSVQMLDNTSEVTQLRQAYGTLAQADHDYKGHRIKAMHAIEKACDVLGTDIRGDGKRKEKQSVSDAQLRAALAIVQQVRSTATQQGQSKVAEHLNHAINELTVALSIK